MLRKRSDTAKTLRDELTCPQCNYSLRGLKGAVVICPECGTGCDITAMMTRQWTGPWFHAPGFTKILLPLTWIFFAMLGVLILLAIDASFRHGPILSITGFIAAIMIWCALMRWVRDEAGRGKGWKLALLAHVLFAGYIFGIIVLLWMVIGAFAMGSWVMTAMVLAMALLPMGLIWLMRRGEKYIAKQCIRAWLNRPVEETALPMHADAGSDESSRKTRISQPLPGES